MKRLTQIICTLGPASQEPAMIRKMADRGMDVARINSSHGTVKQRQNLIDQIRFCNKKFNTKIKVLVDLEGFRIRVGYFDEEMLLEKDKIYWINGDAKRGVTHIPFDYHGDLNSIKKGFHIFIDDGKICCEVTESKKKKIKVKVLQGGILKQRKGINIPRLKLKSNIVTLKDQEDIAFAIQNKVDYIAQSFVRNKRDILRIQAMTKKDLPDCQLIAKIENQDGVRNLDKIIEASDGIMVARGDLGVSLPIYKIPLLQKYIIRRCSHKKKFVITATQMLDSMTEHSRPTRAEVSDVANAILDGTDFVMLSAETAVGHYPSRTVLMMRQIIEYTEDYERFKP